MGNFPAGAEDGELALLKNAIEWLAEGATKTAEWQRSAIALARESKGEQFTDVTDACGMAKAGMSKSVAMGDVDNDGDLDIFATVMLAAGNLFYRNDGKWNFTEMAAAAGVLLPRSAVGSFLGDVDGDGNLDLFVSSESSSSGRRNMLYLGDGQGKFRNVTDRSGSGLSRSPASAMGIWADIDHDGDLDLYLIAYPEPNRLYRNKGDGTFEDATSAFGLSGLGDKRVGAGEFNDVSGSFGDLDGDGYQDLMFFDKTQFRIYRNMGGRRFEDVTAKTGLRDIAGLGTGAGGCLGVALGDIDNDGDLDMYVAKRAPYNVDRGPGGFFVHKGTGRYLLLNDGNMRFTDITEAAGFKAPEAPGRAYGPIFVDVNNDGYLDLFQAQGWGGESLLFRNNGNLTFSDVTGTGGIVGFNVHGYCFGDLDGDGDLDLYTTTWDDAGEFKLHRNNQNDRSYLIVRVKGRKPNTSAMGAKIWVYEEKRGKKGRLRGYREIIGGGGALYTCPTLDQHFGLPGRGTYSVRVFFPVSGKTVSRSNVSAGRTVVVEEP
jgi:hypothetical protein